MNLPVASLSYLPTAFQILQNHMGVAIDLYSEDVSSWIVHLYPYSLLYLMNDKTQHGTCQMNLASKFVYCPFDSHSKKYTPLETKRKTKSYIPAGMNRTKKIVSS